MFVKLYVTVISVCLWQFNFHYASNSIFSRVTLRDYICLLVQMTNRWYVRNHFISNVLKKTKLFSFNTSTVTFLLAVSNLLPRGSREPQLPPSPQTRQIWGIWKLRLAYSPETPNLGQNRWCFVPCDLEIWRMTLENDRTSLLCCFKLYATFHSHWWIQTGVTVRKRPIWVKFYDF